MKRSPQHEADAKERLAIYLEVLDSFEFRERELLRRRLERGQTFEEVAAQLEFPSGDAARKQFHRLYAKLLLRLGAKGVRANS